MKRSKYNLLPYFIDDEKSLATRQAYVKSCEKFFLTLKRTSSPVFEALDREDKAEQDEKAAYQHWKDTNEKK